MLCLGRFFAFVNPVRRLHFDGAEGFFASGELLARREVALASLFEVQRGTRCHGAVEENVRQAAANLPSMIGKTNGIGIIGVMGHVLLARRFQDYL